MSAKRIIPEQDRAHQSISEPNPARQLNVQQQPLAFYRQTHSLEPVVSEPPVCLYLETTNRCNLLCRHCPRTFASVEHPADLSFDRMRQIVDQVPGLKQAVLHGIGEPLINKDLPKMIRYLKERGVYVLFNTNGTMLYHHIRLQLIEAELDECRISIDAADAETFERVRGLPRFDLIIHNCRAFVAQQAELGVAHPKLSLWLVGLKETIDQLPDLVRLAHDMRIKEVYLQRLVYFDDPHRAKDIARSEQGLYGAAGDVELGVLEQAIALAAGLGVTLKASGAVSPEASLMPASEDTPWSLCRRPWTLMYVTANGNVLPCCIAPFAEADYQSLILGNVFDRPLMDIWNDRPYREFRQALAGPVPKSPCQSCGVRWSL